MAKPLPKTILKPQSDRGKVLQPNTPSRSRSLVHLGDEVYWDLNKAANPHMVIMGTSGSGKTQTLKAIVWELYRGFPSRSIVLDFHGDQELPGEICYPIHMASAYGINPLVINLDPEGGGSKLQAISVAATLRRALIMGTNQEGLLILMIGELYEQFGITQENRQTWTIPPPDLGDLEIAIIHRAQGGCKDAQALQIKLAATFQYEVFSRPQIDLSAGKLIRVDLSKLPPELGAIAAEAILKQVMDAHRLAGESPELKTFVFVDEAKELKGSKTLDRITADGRKYGLGIVLATQRETHISPDVLANTATKILLPVDVADIRKVASRFRFDAGRIANLGTFQALVRTGGTAVACTIKPFFGRINS
ncbi:ATP-binding protein [Chamaesiphon minutus]|uniref:Putative ATPase n=1 Tax=Chamaesiphon minutus (strain ATCC 27169 / PCC 6605) TaxID=1173020 RepID=K9UDE0_CHAP6|nr:type IV secretion system DNA-binding domain-containing protein [Chamaesiphon minutus]AFY93132.1 putative ATPase [Chamaesiphon minutus PCC 6605]